MDKLFILLSKPQRRQLVLVVAGTFVAGALEMVGIGAIPAFVGLLVDPEKLLPFLPGSFITDSIRQISKSNLILLGAALVAGVFLFKNLYVVSLIYAETHLAQGLTASISNRLFQGYLHTPYTFHLQRNPAELVRNLTEEAVYASQFVKAGMRLVREGLALIFILVLMVLVEPVVSLIVCSLLVVATGAFFLSVRGALMHRGKLCEDHWSRRVQVISQSLGAIKDAKILGRESHLTQVFSGEVQGLQRHETFYEVVSALPRYVLEAVAVTAIVPIASAFAFLGRPFDEMLPVLALFGVAVIRLVPAMAAINTSLVDIRYRRPAMELVCSELLALEAPRESQAVKSSVHPKFSKMREAICIENVHYRYPEAPTESLAGLSLKITSGTTIAFVGPSGAGKSTLIDIILGLLTPTRGHVLVDGRDIQEDLTGWQRQIGYVPQDIYLFDDSIRRNIAFGLPDDEINDLAVARAVQTAQLEDLVRTLPHGLDTPVGNEGVRLSGGQRQRIAIARALYHDPSILVMDEATNALDHETEREIIGAIDRLRGDRTIILVAHRLTTIRHCDTVYLLNAGKLQDQGNFRELVQRHGDPWEPLPFASEGTLGVA